MCILGKQQNMLLPLPPLSLLLSVLLQAIVHDSQLLGQWLYDSSEGNIMVFFLKDHILLTLNYNLKCAVMFPNKTCDLG